MKHINVAISEESYDALGRRSMVENKAISALVREALDSFLYRSIEVVYVRREVIDALVE